MRKTQYKELDNPILTDTQGLQSLCKCGRVTALKIAEQANAEIRLGRLRRFNVSKIKAYLENVNQL